MKTLHGSPHSHGYEVLIFGTFRLDPVQHVLHEGDRQLRLGSRALEILIMLAERTGQIVSKNELLARVWPKSEVQEATLRVHIAALRKALSDGRGGTRYVENFSGRGYRFVAHVIRQQVNSPLDTTQRPGGLPVPLTPMVGREQAVATLATRIAQRRFVTIVGPGGAGKTVVAAGVAEKLSAAYEHGIRFVDLFTVNEPQLLADALATVLGLGTVPEDPLRGSLDFLQDKSLLLVFDNCEHIVEAAARVAEKVLQRAPGVHILATSREPLRAESEYTYRLLPLAIPTPADMPSGAQALTFPAIQLFIERASASLDSFELHDSDIPVVAEICRRLEGNPLAIELAAAQVDAFGIRGVAARLDDCLGLLTRGRRTALPRHQSLRATLDWSYGLLSPLERVVLRRLAVFPGHIDMECASATVAREEGIPVDEVFGLVANLIAKSLLAKEVCGQGILYRLPAATRAYALEKLRENDELAATTLSQDGSWQRSGAAA